LDDTVCRELLDNPDSASLAAGVRNRVIGSSGEVNPIAVSYLLSAFYR